MAIRTAAGPMSYPNARPLANPPHPCTNDGQAVAAFAPDHAVALDFGLDHGNGGEAGKARFSREAALRGQPGDILADGVTADLDAPRLTVDRLEAVHLTRRGIGEVARNLALQ